MPLGSLKEMYLDELRDLHHAETEAIRALPLLRDAACAPRLRETLDQLCEESRLHLERLDLIFTHWGRPHPTGASDGFAAIVQEAHEKLHRAATAESRDATVVRAATRMNHLQLAAYACAYGWAGRLKRHDDRRLLHDTLEHKREGGRQLEELAGSSSGLRVTGSGFQVRGSGLRVPESGSEFAVPRSG